MEEGRVPERRLPNNRSSWRRASDPTARGTGPLRAGDAEISRVVNEGSFTNKSEGRVPFKP
jgi:hypothetical protein